MNKGYQKEMKQVEEAIKDLENSNANEINNLCKEKKAEIFQIDDEITKTSVDDGLEKAKVQLENQLNEVKEELAREQKEHRNSVTEKDRERIQATETLK